MFAGFRSSPKLHDFVSMWFEEPQFQAQGLPKFVTSGQGCRRRQNALNTVCRFGSKHPWPIFLYTREWWGRKILGKSFADFAGLPSKQLVPKSSEINVGKLGLPVIEANLPGPTIHQCAVPWSTVELTAPRWGRSESLERSAQTHPAPRICKKKRCRTVNYHYSIRDFPWFTHFYICLVKFQYPFIIFSSYFIIWQGSAQAVS